MSKRLFKTLIFGAAAAVVAISAAFAGCSPETNRPEVKITVEFNNTTYELEYTMYRNLYPNTVKHFIELAEEDFYDNTIVHNYTTADWYTGGYGYDADAYDAAVSGSSLGDYLEQHDKEDVYDRLFNDGKLTASVFALPNAKADSALKTLMGEYRENIHQEIEQGALNAGVGTLKMYYYPKESVQTVYVTPTDDQIITANYKNNCATSLFIMQMGTGSSNTANKYCVFAQIKDQTKLDELVADIGDYISGLSSDGNTGAFYTNVNVTVDNNDEFSTESVDRSMTESFDVPETPIIIKSVQITKW